MSAQEAQELARATERAATKDVGLREQPANSNRHPRIDQALAYFDLATGLAYCAALASCWVREAAKALRIIPAFKGSARALGIWERNPDLQIAAADLQADPQLVASILPALFVVDHGQGKGHVYLAIGYDPDTRQTTNVDPNSNGQGTTREGGGVYLTQRPIDAPTLLGAVRIS